MPAPSERLSFAPVEQRVADPNVSGLARRFKVPREAIYRWRRCGLTVERADELAVLVGHHPAELWPESW